jgi:hypothetical protein
VQGGFPQHSGPNCGGPISGPIGDPIFLHIFIIFIHFIHFIIFFNLRHLIPNPCSFFGKSFPHLGQTFIFASPSFLFGITSPHSHLRSFFPLRPPNIGGNPHLALHLGPNPWNPGKPGHSFFGHSFLQHSFLSHSGFFSSGFFSSSAILIIIIFFMTQ